MGVSTTVLQLVVLAVGTRCHCWSCDFIGLRLIHRTLVQEVVMCIVS